MTVRNIRFAERIYTLAVPSLGVDVGFRFDVVDKVNERILFDQTNLVFSFCLIGKEAFMRRRM